MNPIVDGMIPKTYKIISPGKASSYVDILSLATSVIMSNSLTKTTLAFSFDVGFKV